MNHIDEPANSPTALDVGRRAAEELGAALALADCKFPSLSGGFPVMGRGYVELGGVSADTAFTLARWIREHA